MTNITIPVDCLKTALAVMPKNEIRYYLNGLHINVQGRWLETTDGLIALRIPLPFEPPAGMGNVIVSREAIAEIVGKAKTQRVASVTLHLDAGSLYRAAVGDSDVVLTSLGGWFPNLDAVFSPRPLRDDVRPYCLDAKLLDKWFKAQRARFCTAYLHHDDEPPVQCTIGYLFKRDDMQCVIAAYK